MRSDLYKKKFLMELRPHQKKSSTF